jgi:hypothetical protein
MPSKRERIKEILAKLYEFTGSSQMVERAAMGMRLALVRKYGTYLVLIDYAV